jgi:hypothetical protein
MDFYVSTSADGSGAEGIVGFVGIGRVGEHTFDVNVSLTYLGRPERLGADQEDEARKLLAPRKKEIEQIVQKEIDSGLGEISEIDFDTSGVKVLR